MESHNRICFPHPLVLCGVLSLLFGLPTAGAAADLPLKSPLKFRDDHRFKILAFGDVHWDRHSDKDAQTLQAMETIVDAEKPDFVIYTGDNCLGEGRVTGLEIPPGTWMRLGCNQCGPACVWPGGFSLKADR